MPKNKEQKKQLFETIEKKLKDAKSVIFADFTGLSMEKLRKLRSALKKEGIYYKVAKKNILNLVLSKLGFNLKEEEGILGKKFKGSVSIALSEKEDAIIPKILYQFSKTNEALKILGGLLNGKITPAKEIIVLATLPSKEELIAKLAFVLKFPLTKLAMTVKEVGAKKVV